MKKIKFIAICLILVLILPTYSSALEIKEQQFDFNVKSAVLMDANTGTVLYSNNMNEALPPASVTKIMTLLLVFEAIEEGKLKLDDTITVSEYASSMGGSQVYLEPGETMCVDELIKCVVVASANDAALALSEAVAGSEESFVNKMNKRANELGMKNTHFENVTGLDDTTNNHLTSAYDIALMSKELLKHERICNYTTIWMDTIRNGEFGISNTNRLIKSYKGITGLKTGSTSKAGFCISASAKRGDLHLIAVIMGAQTSAERNAYASKLLDYGFSNYGIYNSKERKIITKIMKGEKEEILVGYDEVFLLENVDKISKIQEEMIINEKIKAPIKKGDIIGKITYKLDGETICEKPIYALEDVNEMTFGNLFVKLLKKFVLK